MNGPFMALAASLLVAASVGTQPPGDGGYYEARTREDFDKAVTFPYVAGKERAAALHDGVPALRRCMPQGAIRQLIGSPDFGKTYFTSGKSPKKPWVSLWYYYLSKPAQRDRPGDAYVLVMVDGKQRLHSVFSSESAKMNARIEGSREACD